jgi:TonB family protein
MTLRRLLLVLLTLVCASCQTSSSQYQFGQRSSSSPPVSRPDAEQLLAEKTRIASAKLVPEYLDRPLQAISLRLPEYPSAALRDEAEGDVDVEFTIGIDGLVKDVRALRSPNEHLTNAAISAVSQWRFMPPTKAGEPFSVRIALPLTFSLR